jgi:hypothetical protein
MIVSEKHSDTETLFTSSQFGLIIFI